MPPRLEVTFTGTGDPVHFVSAAEDPPLQSVDLVDKRCVWLAGGRKKTNYGQSSPMDIKEPVPVGEMPEVRVFETPERHLADPREYGSLHAVRRPVRINLGTETQKTLNKRP